MTDQQNLFNIYIKKEADKMIAYQSMTTVQMCCCRMLFSRADKMARRVSIHCCAPKENT